jgi:hypothetical protein
MNMNVSTGWSSLLAEPIRRYERQLSIVRGLAADAPSGKPHLVVAGVDEALAALVALRGPAECKDFFPAIQPLMTEIGEELSMFPGSVDAVSMMSVFCLSEFSATMAIPPVLSEFNVDEKLKEITSYRNASMLDKVTATLICLCFGRAHEVRYLPANVDAAAASLIKLLAAALEAGSGSKEVEPAWDAYLRVFPRALAAKTAEWRQLLLAARLAMGKFGGVPVGEVAERLHRRIKQLAEEESA